MTPAELLALADAATPGPWEVGTYEIFSPASKECLKRIAFTHEWMNESDARLIALAPDLARLCAEMGEVLDVLRNGYDDHERECASLWEEPSRSMPCDCAVGVIDAALANLSELEPR